MSPVWVHLDADLSSAPLLSSMNWRQVRGPACCGAGMGCQGGFVSVSLLHALWWRAAEDSLQMQLSTKVMHLSHLSPNCMMITRALSPCSQLQWVLETSRRWERLTASSLRVGSAGKERRCMRKQTPGYLQTLVQKPPMKHVRIPRRDSLGLSMF